MYIRTSNRSGNKFAKIITFGLSGFVVIFALIQFFIPHFLPAIFTTITRPFWRIEFSVMSGSLESSESLLQENQSLQRDIQALRVQNSSVSFVQTENNELLSLLGRPDAVSFVSKSGPVPTSTDTISSSSQQNIYSSLKLIGNRVLGAVLLHPPLALYDELIADAGTDQGIVLGAKVYAPGNVLIGTTADVLGQTSKVTLFSSPGLTYPVLIGSGHTPALAIGRGGGQYEAHVPQATQIVAGDSISDATISGSLFGTVTAVIENASDPFETVLFSPPVNIYQLRWVLIETQIATTNSTNQILKVPPQTATTTHVSTPKTVLIKLKK